MGEAGWEAFFPPSVSICRLSEVFLRYSLLPWAEHPFPISAGIPEYLQHYKRIFSHQSISEDGCRFILHLGERGI